jgi:hypothetical protein
VLSFIIPTSSIVSRTPYVFCALHEDDGREDDLAGHPPYYFRLIVASRNHPYILLPDAVGFTLHKYPIMQNQLQKLYRQAAFESGLTIGHKLYLNPSYLTFLAPKPASFGTLQTIASRII